MVNDANVVIVGAGLAGGLVAESLLAMGVTGIVILDAGPPVLMRDRRTWLDVITTGAVPYAKLYDDPADVTATGNDPWKITGGRLFGRGGSTLHWGGWCPRFMPEDFQQFTNTGMGTDWPYLYSDLEPYYVRAERYLQVGGDEVPGQRDWRSAPYPMNGPTLPITAGPIIAAMNELGYSYQSMPVARNTVSINGQSPCMTNNTCHYCPIGGRFTADQTFDRLANSTQVQLLTNAAATAITMSSKSQANGVQYMDVSTGEQQLISANYVFVCNGALEAPKLLLASVSPYWPQGLGNDNGLVGAYLVANPYINCAGILPKNPNALQQELAFPTFCSRQFDTPEEQANGKFLMNMAEESPFLDPATMMYKGWSASAIGAAVNGPASYMLQGALSAFGYKENTVGLAPGTTRFGLPRTAINTPTPIVPAQGITLNQRRMSDILRAMDCGNIVAAAYPQRGDHAASTCRMSLDDQTGVVDTSLRIWNVSNVYIASNAVVPAIGAANVTLTTTAVMLKAFDSMISQGRRF